MASLASNGTGNYVPTGSYYIRIKPLDVPQYATDVWVWVNHSPPNRAPVARMSADTWGGVAPLTVRFDGGSSYDPDGDSLTYSWSFGDGTTGSGRWATNTYGNQAGTAPP